MAQFAPAATTAAQERLWIVRGGAARALFQACRDTVRGKERRLELDVLEPEGVEGVEGARSLRQSVNLVRDVPSRTGE